MCVCRNGRVRVCAFVRAKRSPSRRNDVYIWRNSLHPAIAPIACRSLASMRDTPSVAQTANAAVRTLKSREQINIETSENQQNPMTHLSRISSKVERIELLIKSSFFLRFFRSLLLLS